MAMLILMVVNETTHARNGTWIVVSLLASWSCWCSNFGLRRWLLILMSDAN
jgi:hypothetical protein